ncbi:MAG: acetate--CoA ligase family protein [Candidatus Falkowbacteria bacterium]
MSKLKTLFEPKSVAVIGASGNPEKLGWQILNNIKNGGFKGKVYPISLKEKKILNHKCYTSISAVKSAIDLAVIVIPGKFVLDEVKKCAAAKVANVVIISAGFGEINEAGKRLETEMATIARKANMRIVGPNCLGIISAAVNLNATFAKFNPHADIKRRNNIAVISQSGAVGSAALDFIASKNIGFSSFISLGNKADLDEGDFFQHFFHDNKTDLVVAYLEEIKNGLKFMNTVSRLAKIKPVAVLKAGRTQKGGLAAMSHTGSLTASNDVIVTALKRSGAIVLDNVSDMFNLMRLIKKPITLDSFDFNIVSNAGGPLVMTVDEISSAGYGLNKALDIIGDADAKKYQKTLVALLADKKINNILVILTPQTSTEVEKTAEIIGRLAKRHTNKLICASFIGGEAVSEGKKILAKYMVPSYDYPEEAVRAMGKFMEYQKIVKKLKVFAAPKIFSENYSPAGAAQMDYLESFQVLSDYNIPAIETIKVDKDSLGGIKYPAVLKVVGKDLIHKTDRQAVFINVPSMVEAGDILTNNELLKDKDNYLVAQPMVKSDYGLILGFRRDHSFGPILMIGYGGIYTEIFKDVQLEVGDIDKTRAMAMIEKLRVYPILKGARGAKSYDLDSLADILVKLAKIASEHYEIKEFDINPMLATHDGFTAVDVRIII